MNERPSLFRAEASQSRDAGASLGTRAVSWRAVGAALAATAALGFGFSAFAGVARKETLSGYLRPAGGAVRVVAPLGGTIASVDVTPGQQVQAGARLLLIETRREVEGGGDLTRARTQALDRQIAALRSRLAAEESSAGLSQSEARSRLSGLREEAQSLGEQRRVQAERIATTEQRLKDLAPVRAKGYISEDEFRNREEYLLSLRQGLSGSSGRLRKICASKGRRRSKGARRRRRWPSGAGRCGPSLRSWSNGGRKRAHRARSRCGRRWRAGCWR